MSDLHGWLLGRLSWDALPFYSAIATVAAGVLVAGVLAAVLFIAATRRWGYLWREWLTSLDHKRIGVMYVVLALVMLVRGVIEGVLLRTQQAVAINNPGFLPPEHFSQLFTTHGTIMIFFMAMPFLTGLINIVVPLQIGARDVRFALLNAISLWLTVAGAGLVMISLVLGRFSTGGWSGYPPYTEPPYQTGVGPDYWIWALTLSSIGATLTGINFATTLYKERAPGMAFMRLPLFAWTALCTSILMIFAMPPLTVATLLLALDRYLGFHFFSNTDGGNLMNYINLFWLFGHPEVYILVLPSFGIFSEVFPTFSAKRLYGYTSLVLATLAITVLSFTVWLHHFFTMGQSAGVNAAFGIATMLIAIPTGVKIYDWMLTMFRGRVRLTVPLIYASLFLMLFVVGGLTGMTLATPPVDFQLHNTTYLVAHFHNMLIPGTLFGLLAGYTYWFPKVFGFRLNEHWGRVAAVCFGLGFLLAFMPLYLLGAAGMPRRLSVIHQSAFAPALWVAEAGAVLLFAAVASLVVQLIVSIRQRDHTRAPLGDPWNGRTLEWASPSPPPAYNFAVLPAVHDRDAFMWLKEQGQAYRAVVQPAPINMPRNTPVALFIGAASFVAAFGLVWHIGWAALGGVLAAVACVVVRSFNRHTHQTVSSAELAAEHNRWVAAVQAAEAVNRDLELDPRNRGRAEPTL
ncbi:cbb3-type cytochrome c oxidase subunit I [Pseudomonas typographi]|uniref:Cytochrome ubiquinol oxidase subunit I n=1 Tax=Pseudomonas typographi TaxID=2715964 RepID=A0ABR7Z746_9PSED|nr:cbb3-type cytochrome c oxidase subunit I [Pseudomonas typographi]MBD1601370.1 cytochrome ubiquinol oxidase subunit I [Pseudomonas typographi]